MKRGDLVTVALQGNYGKPRPGLVVQSNLFSEHPSISIAPVTGELRATPLFRINVMPDPENSLRKPSQIMADKIQAVQREKDGSPFGQIDPDTMQEVDDALALWFGLR